MSTSLQTSRVHLERRTTEHMGTTVFITGRILRPEFGAFSFSRNVKDGHVVHVGFDQDEKVPQARRTAPMLDLSNRVSLPGFDDGYLRTLNFETG
ncbi:hypothetical protein N7508_002694 [Penicillium antarcticum]|uniref:uncharacterized protein n=1 Tax=Penicillium antarcticum TaxID=416450 RepID=UPI00238906EF|nr:uncharacterized protein N7508_002694 [Penicillium antarcticum]KAJ5318186.1 hypothetical protein N7508_002694 [Penicillium antarcticum]